mmetsp:Transcript_1206/g.2487  ORF Transcript_1206/g.2487 Transcript_1206/m.2487 type:complete len:203 (-) Transcript_1206:530-1138(-)
MPRHPRIRGVVFDDQLLVGSRWNIERPPAGHHLIQHDAATEEVGLRGDLQRPHLGRHGVRSSSPMRIRVVAGLEDLRNAQVDHDRMRPDEVLGPGLVPCAGDDRDGCPLVRHQHNVRRLQVQMHNAPDVNIRDRGDDLEHDVGAVLLRKGPMVEFGLRDGLLELAAGAIIHHQVGVFGVLAERVQFDDVGVVQAAQIRDLVG